MSGPPSATFQVDKETIYKEQRAHHGRVHNSMYAMPPSFAVVLGALWFFAANQLEKAPAISLVIFIFSSLTARYFHDTYKGFAARAAELRQHLQVFEGDYAFYNDKHKELVAAKEVYDRYGVQLPPRLTQEIDAERALPAVGQLKTRDAFMRLMKRAEYLSYAASALSAVKCILLVTGRTLIIL